MPWIHRADTDNSFPKRGITCLAVNRTIPLRTRRHQGRRVDSFAHGGAEQQGLDPE